MRVRGVGAKRPLFVLQMGKVGSSSVTKALMSAVSHRPVFQLHVISDHGLKSAVARIRESENPSLDRHLIESLVLSNTIKKLPHIEIITLTRDPIARAVSFVVQDLTRHCPGARTSTGTIDWSKVETVILNKLSAGTSHHDPTQWFNQEILEPFNVDVFSQEFEPRKGALIMTAPRVSLICVRMEDLGRTETDSSLSQFVESSQLLTFSRENASANKPVADEYREFVKGFRIPHDLCQKIYETRYARHFYRNEIPSLIEKWSGSEVMNA